MRCNIDIRFVANSALLALLVMCPAAVQAQVMPAGAVKRYSNACIDHLPPGAFTRVAVYATNDIGGSASSAFAATADNFLQELVITAQRLLGARPNTLPRGEPTIDWQGVDDELDLMAYRDGRVIASPPKVGAAAAALMARALSSDSTPVLLDFSADSARDSIPFSIRFVRPLLDSAGHVSKPEVKRAAVPLLSISAPWERQVSHKPGGEAPHYPDDARRSGYEGSLLLQFIVDSTGRAVDATVKDLWPRDEPRLKGEKLAMYERFLEATKRAIPRLAFVPALIGGCPVNQLVQMPFKFGLNRW